jgi:iron complex outermembrane receptor protein
MSSFLGGVVLAGQAWSQAGGSARPPAVEADSSTVGLEEITVTAQRREENLQKTPLAVVAITGDQLVRSGVLEAQDLNKLVPGLKIGQTGSMTQFFINGVGSGVANSYGDPTIAFNVDGVYIGRPTGVNGVFYDLSRVEVLKGPQGTLYGRNAAAGAVNVVTNRPEFKDSVEAGLEVGNYNLLKITGVANVELSDTSALRLSGLSSRHDGYLSDGYDDEDDHAGRVQYLWKPTDRLTVLLAGDYFQQGGRGDAAVPVPFVDSSNPWAGPSTAGVTNVLSAATPTVPAAARIHFLPQDGYLNNTNEGLRAEVTWQADEFSVTAIGSHRRTIQIGNIIPGAFEQYQNSRANANSAEFRAESNNDGRLKWLAGLYYYNESVNSYAITERYFQGNSYLSLTPLTDKTAAAFTQETFSVTDRFRFTGGIRYTYEKKTEDGYNTAITGITVPADGSARFSAINYKAGLEFDLTPQSLLYANYATGFKAGGFYQGGPPNTYKPEKLTSYSVGSKNRFLDNRLQVNLEAFYWDYRDKQFATFAFINPAPATALITVNIPKVTFKGVSADLAYVPWSQGQVTLTAQYLDAVNQVFTYPSLVPTGNCPSTKEPDGYLIDCSGKPLSQAPRFSATLGFNQAFDLGSHGTLTPGFSTHFETSSLASQTMDYVAALEQSTWTITDMFLSYGSSSDKWRLQAYVNNVGDKAVKTNGASQPTTPTVYFANILPPRTYGLRFDVKLW